MYLHIFLRWYDYWNLGKPTTITPPWRFYLTGLACVHPPLTKMYCFMCCFSKLDNTSHYTAKNQNTVKTNFLPAHTHTHAHTHTRTHTHTQLLSSSTTTHLGLQSCKYFCYYHVHRMLILIFTTNSIAHTSKTNCRTQMAQFTSRSDNLVTASSFSWSTRRKDSWRKNI